MALKAYTLDLALQTSSEFAIGHTIPNVDGIATDGKGFIPTKNSTNKTITLSKGFGKFGGRLFEMTEQTVYSWDAGSTDADAYLVIDLTKQNSFTGTIEDGTYAFVDNQSSIVLSATQPEPSANTLVYKLDGNYQTQNKRQLNSIDIVNGSNKTTFTTLNSGSGNISNSSGVVSISGNAQLDNVVSTSAKTATFEMYGLTLTFVETAANVLVNLTGNVTGLTTSGNWQAGGQLPSNITAPDITANLVTFGASGVPGGTTYAGFGLNVQFNSDRGFRVLFRHFINGNTGNVTPNPFYMQGSVTWNK